MKSRVFGAGAVALAMFLGGCGFKLFETVETDPHPPSISNVQVSPTVVRSGDTFVVSLDYFDEGGDIVSFQMEDIEGAGTWTILPSPAPGAGSSEPAPEFFPGTSGTAVTPPDSLPSLIASQLGPHRIRIWAQDSHESRSEKIEFVMTVE